MSYAFGQIAQISRPITLVTVSESEYQPKKSSNQSLILNGAFIIFYSYARDVWEWDLNGGNISYCYGPLLSNTINVIFGEFRACSVPPPECNSPTSNTNISPPHAVTFVSCSVKVINVLVRLLFGVDEGIWQGFRQVLSKDNFSLVQNWNYIVSSQRLTSKRWIKWEEITGYWYSELHVRSWIH